MSSWILDFIHFMAFSCVLNVYITDISSPFPAPLFNLFSFTLQESFEGKPWWHWRWTQVIPSDTTSSSRNDWLSCSYQWKSNNDLYFIWNQGKFQKNSNHALKTKRSLTSLKGIELCFQNKVLISSFCIFCLYVL